MTTIDIVLLGAIVTLAGKLLYDGIKGRNNKPNADIPLIKECVDGVSDNIDNMGKQLAKMEEQLTRGVSLAEDSRTSYQQFIIAINDLSNITKNVLVATKEQTAILTKALMINKG